MSQLDLQTYKDHCPYCGEPMELVIDPSLESQVYVEDCWVCCQPIVVSVTLSGEEIYVSLMPENE